MSSATSADQTSPSDVPSRGPRAAQLFPKLTDPQLDRVEAHGRRRRVRGGEVLIELGDTSVSFFVVLSGGIEIVTPDQFGVDRVIVVHEPREFTGEVHLLSGRRTVVRARASADGEVLELSRDELLRLVQTDAELSEVLMSAFVARRLELFERNWGDVTLVGSSHSADTLRIRDFLARNKHPHTYVDLDRDPDVEHLLSRFQVAVDEIPVLICRGTTFLRNPSNKAVAELLGLNETVAQTEVRDLVVVGAGPAGLAASVYGASEGLDVLIMESGAPGGQAGSSSKIENYLGFPSGISGTDLANLAYSQVQKFQATLLVARSATSLVCDAKPYRLGLDDGSEVSARTVIIATGAQYRRLPLPDLSRFEGLGVYYGATYVEAQLCGGDEVIVVGGGNSAGQAAVFLAQSARHVHMLVRAGGLAETMSRYLIHRIENHKRITLHTRTEIAALEGGDRLERVRWRNNATGEEETRQVRHVFVMTGASPNTEWLRGCVALDAHGFIKTGPDLTREDLEAAGWPLKRPPSLLETSLPGVFAVGDVRSGNVKRVASAVGEGSIAVSFVHKALQE